MSKTQKTFFITTPIYYASGDLHIGHLYTTTLAWTIANYKKLKGFDVKFLTGSDEHGQKIANKALEFNQNPQTYVDSFAKKYQKLWDDFGIDYNFYSRTSSKFHSESVKKIFSFFLTKGFIYKGKYEGLYSVPDEEFLTKTQAMLKTDGQYYHPSSGHCLELVSEESYFFKMSLFTNWLLDQINLNEKWMNPKKIVKELKNNFLFKGLEDLSVTRTNVKWGIKIKEDTNHTIYVWLDALCNYITALGFDIKNSDENFVKYWQNGDEIVHILGKEISRFHFVYWPIFLKALNIKQPTRLIGHGWIITPNGKMSKSKGNVINPYELLSKYHKEMIKYYLVSQINIGEDGIYEENHFKEVINSDLINNYGNLVSRTLKMIFSIFKNGVKFKEIKLEIHNNIEKKILDSVLEYQNLFDDFKIDEAMKIAIKLSSHLNKYIDETKPWTFKEKSEELEIILSRALNGIYAVAVFLSVVLPIKMQEVITDLGLTKISLENITNFYKFDNIKQAEKFILFERIK